MTRVLFRVDVGPAIGLGHLARSLALAAAGRDAGMQCVFLAVGSVIGYRAALKLVTGSGFEAEIVDQVVLGGREDLERTLYEAARHSSDVVVVDSYHVDGQFFERLRAAGLFVIANDDVAPYPFPCQLVVNGGAHARELLYRSSSGDTRFLLGPEYAMLRPEFRDLPRRAVCAVARNILVTLGGADPCDLMPKLLRLLAELPGDFEVAAISGPFFKNLGVVERIASRWRGKVRLCAAPDSMRDLMLRADVAIAAAGQTLYELIATGTPTVAIQVADNQCRSLRALARSGVVHVAGRASDVELLKRVGVIVEEMRFAREARSEMAARGQQLVDGRGAARVAEWFRVTPAVSLGVSRA